MAAATARCLRTSVNTFAFRFFATNHVRLVSNSTPHIRQANNIFVLENENTRTMKLSEIISLVAKFPIVALNAAFCSSLSDS